MCTVDPASAELICQLQLAEVEYLIRPRKDKQDKAASEQSEVLGNRQCCTASLSFTSVLVQLMRTALPRRRPALPRRMPADSKREAGLSIRRTSSTT